MKLRASKISREISIKKPAISFAGFFFVQIQRLIVMRKSLDELLENKTDTCKLTGQYVESGVLEPFLTH